MQGRSLCYSTRARWLHVGTPAHVCPVYGRPVLNLRERAGRYTTLLKSLQKVSEKGSYMRLLEPLKDVGPNFAVEKDHNHVIEAFDC